jgi:Cid1 family poly A polymerase
MKIMIFHYRIIDGWNANFAHVSLRNLNIAIEKDFKKYLLGFYHFYGHEFDFNNYIICTLTGTRVPKNIFDHGKESNLPPVFRRYADYMRNVNVEEADEVDELFSNFKPMVVQDPFELIHNVSKGVHEGKLNKIISYMQLTHELLKEAKF